MNEPNKEIAAEVLPIAEILPIVKAFPGFDKLVERLEKFPDEKRAAAKFFLDSYFRHIVDSLVNLFAESGTSVYYAIETIWPLLKKKLGGVDSAGPDIYLTTNSFLVFQYVLCLKRYSSFIFPWGPPDDQYGGFYGNLERVNPEPAYGQKLVASDHKAVKALLDRTADITKWDGPTLILGATSGLQMSRGPVPKDGTPNFEEYKRILAGMGGPHTGSHNNKLFKRFLHDTEIPQVIFVDADKVDLEIDVTSCRFVYDSAEAWEDALQNRPLAFCVGGEKREIEAKIEVFASKPGMKIIHAPKRPGETSAFLARTPRFIQRFEREALGLPNGIEG